MVVPVFTQDAIRVDFPVTVGGVSAKSNGGSNIAKDGMQHLDRYISEFGDYEIHSTLYPKASFHENMIPDCILKAMDLFPDFYRELKFNYTAMWAFGYRLGKYSRWQVLQARNDIRTYHPFSAVRFLYYSAIHDAAIQRRKLLGRMTSLGPFAMGAPENVDDFVVALSKWSEFADPAPEGTIK